MLKIKILFLFISVFSVTAFAQGDPFPKHRRLPEKIAELEKIKLIETLEMDEETTLRFFSRRAENQKKTDELFEKIEDKLDELDEMVHSEGTADDEKLKSIIAEINNLHQQVGSEREKFFNSLPDILTYKQIAKLLVFERRFKVELKDAIFKDRKLRRNKNLE